MIAYAMPWSFHVFHKVIKTRLLANQSSHFQLKMARGAPDSAFYYPGGYQICRIVEKNPAGLSFFSGWILELLKKIGVFTIFWLEMMGKKLNVFFPRAQRCSTCVVEKWQVFLVIDILVEHTCYGHTPVNHIRLDVQISYGYNKLLHQESAKLA